MKDVMEEEQTLIRNYLFGRLPDDKRQQLEQRIMLEDAFFDQLLIEEDEVIDQSVQGLLSPQEQREFETSFLVTPERRQKLKFARALAKHSETILLPESSRAKPAWHGLWSRLQRLWTPAGGRPALSLLSYAVLLLSIAGSVWLFAEERRSQQELRQLQSVRTDSAGRQAELEQQLAEARSRNSELTQQLLREQQSHQASVEGLSAQPSPREALLENSGQPPRSAVFAVSVIPGLTRGAADGMAKFTLPREVTTAELNLKIDNGQYRNYVAVLQDDRGAPLKNFKLKSPKSENSQALKLRIPATLLKPGDYRITLSGQAADGSLNRMPSYAFRVLNN